MIESDVYRNFAQRIIIEFLTNEGLRPTEILRKLQGGRA